MPLTLTRSLLTVLIPGMVAVAPWLLLLVLQHQVLIDWYKRYPLPLHVSSFAVVVILGATLEGIGSYIEHKWDRSHAKKQPPSYQNEDWVAKDWFSYLSRSFGDSEPVGYRYLSRKVTTLYFELGLMLAAPISILGLSRLYWHLAPDKFFSGFVVAVFSIIAFMVFRKLARDTHCVLRESRHYINMLCGHARQAMSFSAAPQPPSPPARRTVG